MRHSALLPLGVMVSAIVFSLSAVCPAVEPGDLLAWWRLDEGSGTVITDSVSGLAGTLIGSPQWTPGLIGKALTFNGTSDGVEVYDADLPDSFTISFWVNPDRTDDGQIFLAKMGPTGDMLLAIGYQDGYAAQLREYYTTGGTKTTGWQHLAVVVEEAAGSSQVTFYRNGEAIWTETWPVVAGDLSGKPWTLAHAGYDFARTGFTKGQFSDVRVYGVALTAEQVQDVLNEVVEDSPLGSFVLGEIPSSTVWHGDTYSFLVKWDGHPSCILAAEALSPVVGEITLARLPLETPPGWWFFSYTPDVMDKFPFTVAMTGVDGDEIFNQSFEISPMGKLVPEQTVFDPTKHTQSGLIEIDDPDPQITTALKTVPMNYQDVYPKTVLIRRQTIEIQQGHPNGYYELFDGARDIQKMEMIAETVVIRSPLHLLQTTVFIRARELRFEGPDAAIVTTPAKNTAIPGQSVAGGNGLRAGDVTLEIGDLLVTHPGTKFDLRHGQIFDLHNAFRPIRYIHARAIHDY